MALEKPTSAPRTTPKEKDERAKTKTANAKEDLEAAQMPPQS